MHDIQHCFIYRPSDFTVSEDPGIEPRTVATTALAVRRSNHSAKYHPSFFLYGTRCVGLSQKSLSRYYPFRATLSLAETAAALGLTYDKGADLRCRGIDQQLLSPLRAAQLIPGRFHFSLHHHYSSRALFQM